ncbi:RNA helicase [Facklamia sp. P13064]|uniref:RNA helicase n=1 Tax=unclassified Facklamia TaxID=2622293 RepID=UPI003D1666D3
METVRIMLHIWAGPIWGCTFDEDKGEYDYDIELIVKDDELMRLHQIIQDLYSSNYVLTENGVITNTDQEKADKERMLDLLVKLIARLNEINEGSFIIDDRETERVRSL